MEKIGASLRAKKAHNKRKMVELAKENREIGYSLQCMENECLAEAWELMTEIQVLNPEDREQYKKGLRLMTLGRMLNCEEYREIGRDFYENHCRAVSHQWFNAMASK